MSILERAMEARARTVTGDGRLAKRTQSRPDCSPVRARDVDERARLCDLFNLLGVVGYYVSVHM